MSNKLKLHEKKKIKYYSKHKIVSWSILGKFRKKSYKNSKFKWKYLRFSALNVKDFFGNTKKQLGAKPFYSKKEDFRVKPRLSVLKKSYGNALKETRKFKAFFGNIQRSVLNNKIAKFYKFKRFREKVLINYFESRLDIIVYRLGFSLSIAQSSHFISKGLIFVNDKKVLIKSFQVNVGDKLSFKPVSYYNNFFFDMVANNQNKVPSYFEFNAQKLEGFLIRKPLKKELMYPELFSFKDVLRRLNN